jgi:hypothetical protein
MSGHPDEITQLRAELTAMRRRLEELESDRVEARSDRRGFFKLAAGAAAGVLVAGVAGAEPAAAATNGPLLIGKGNNPDAVADVTALDSPSPTALMSRVLVVNNFSVNTTSIDSTFRAAVDGRSCDADAGNGFRIGLLGQSHSLSDTTVRGVGVYGVADSAQAFTPATPVGVFGHAHAAGAGVMGQVDTSDARGVHGLATNGVGVQAEATASGGVGLNATAPTSAIAARVDGRLRQVAAGSAGPPTFFANIGEFWRDSLGDLYVCTVTGTPGTWRKVVAQHPSFASAGGSINLFTNPIRVVDTRAGQGAPQNNGSQKLAVNTDVTFQITGQVVSAVSVPAGARGILGNVTAVDPNDAGYLSVFPNTFANTSNINYVPNQTTANALICALSAAGSLKMRSSVSTTNVILDIVGFLF